jgi:osmotically-inducible protein OsmY
MKITIQCSAAMLGLGMALLSGGCGRDSGIEVRHDAKGSEQIHIDNQKLKDNFHQAGRELKKDAQELGRSVKQGARQVDQRFGPAAREALSDGALTARVKARLIAAPDLGGVGIHVDSRDGRVTLSGTVTSLENRHDAEKIARRTDGVVEVVNELEVGPLS